MYKPYVGACLWAFILLIVVGYIVLNTCTCDTAQSGESSLAIQNGSVRDEKGSKFQKHSVTCFVY